MASAIFNPLCLYPPSSSSSPTIVRKPPIYASLSTSQISQSKTPIFRSLTWMGLTPICSWNGLRPNGFSISLQSLRLERRKCKRKGMFASLFGVGAPEALVIGVVALLVFGPKGLAEVAKNLGKTLRAFQPTIRELQEVSRDFKSTLEKEIGLDELKNPAQGNYTSTTQSLSPSPAVSPKDSESTATTPAISADDSPATETTSSTATYDSLATVTAPAASPEEPQETTTAPAVTTENSQPTVDPSNGSHSSKAYSSEDLLKITEEQLKAAASAQQKERISSEPPTPSQDS